MWDENPTWRRNSWTILSLVGYHIGGNEATFEIIRETHKIPDHEFVGRVEAQVEQCPVDGLELWMTITRLLRDRFSNLLSGQLNRWLQIPWVCSHSRD